MALKHKLEWQPPELRHKRKRENIQLAELKKMKAKQSLMPRWNNEQRRVIYVCQWV